MKFTIYWVDLWKEQNVIPQNANREKDGVTININTIDELAALQKEVGGYSLIVDFNPEPSIEIYNDYRE